MILRADAEIPTGQIQELIKTCQESGFEKFALKAKQEASDGWRGLNDNEL